MTGRAAWCTFTSLLHECVWWALVSALFSVATAVTSCPASKQNMEVLRVVPAGTTHPFGDHRTVDQAFPAGVPSEDSDP